MALFVQCLEPLGFLQSLRSLALGAVAQLRGTASGEELAFVRREVAALERDLAAGPGLLEDAELSACEDAVAGAFAQLCLALRAPAAQAPREAELLLQRCAQEQLERRLLVLWRRVQGAAVLALRPPVLEQAAEQLRPRRPQMARLCRQLNAVLGAGLLSLLAAAGLSGRDPALLLGVWGERVGAVHARMHEALARCAGFFREQAGDDVQRVLDAEAPSAPAPADLAARVLRQLEQNYDWLRWAVVVWRPEGRGAAREREQQPPEQEGGDGEALPLARGSFVAGRAPDGLRLVACYAENPAALDKARTGQLIGEVEWKLPNPPPEVYASLEAEPSRAGGYLARRMLQKLSDGLGPDVTLLVVPGKVQVKSGFPPAASLLHEYRHRLASGTVCVFGCTDKTPPR